MSEHLTHVAVYEDTCRMVERSNKISPALKTCLQEQYDSGMICSGSRGNHLFAVPILRTCRKQWKNGDRSPETQQKIAGALGWLTHRAADLHAKPLFWAVDDEKNPKYSGDEYRIYHDAVVLKKVYKGGKTDTLSAYEYFSPALLEPHMKSERGSYEFQLDRVEPYFTRFWQTEFVKLHHFSSEFENSQDWFTKLFKNIQDYSENLKKYFDAFHSPDPDKMQKYIIKPNFYDENDTLIRYVRAIQGGSEPAVELETAIESDDNASDYAQMIKKSYEFLTAANRYFHEEINDTQIYDAVQIHGKHRK